MYQNVCSSFLSPELPMNPLCASFLARAKVPITEIAKARNDLARFVVVVLVNGRGDDLHTRKGVTDR